MLADRALDPFFGSRFGCANQCQCFLRLIRDCRYERRIRRRASPFRSRDRGSLHDRKRKAATRSGEEGRTFRWMRALILGNRLNYSRARNRIMGRARIWPSRVRLTSVSSPNRFTVRRKVPSILTGSVRSRHPPRRPYRSSPH